jgi:alpha-glucosidase
MTFYAIDKSHSHGYNFLEVTEEAQYYQIQTSKMCSSKDMRVSIYDLNEMFYLKTIGFPLGGKLRVWRYR